MREFAVIEAPVQGLEKDGPHWLEALPVREYHTKQYGAVPITMETLDRMVTNFKNNVRGQEIAVDFEHGYDRAKGNQAAGWFKDFDIRPSSADPKIPALYAQVDFTEDAKAEIKANKWKYFSLEWDDNWEDNDGKEHQDVITGGGITNRPIAKHMLPINFSEAMWEELDDEEKKEFAVWSTKYVNDLPNSAFLYVEAGADKDKSKRHLPFKNSEGAIDLPHLRNAIARIPQMKGISSELKNRLQAKARKLLAGASKAMAEGDVELKIFSSLVAEILDEEKEMEHSEPGTGSPPTPREDESGEDDPAIEGGWRRDTPPPEAPHNEVKLGWSEPTSTASSTTEAKFTPTPKKGGKELSVYEFNEKDGQELLRTLDLPVDAKPETVVEAVKIMFGELDGFKKAEKKEEQEKKFAESYPLVWAEHVELMETNRKNAAHAFSETVTKVKRYEGKGLKGTQQELSKVAIDKIEEVHRKFADGEGTVDDFEDAIKAIVVGGIVTFGEIGSKGDGEDDIPSYDPTTAAGITGARKAFSELMQRAMAEDPELDADKAMELTAKKHPDLFEASRATISA